MFKKVSTTVLITAIASISLVGCQSTGTQEEKLYPFTFDTAKISYNISGDATGTKVAYIKGNKSSVEVHKTRKVSGVEQTMDTLTIDSGEYIYKINLNSKSGSVSKNPVYDELIKTPAANRADFLNKLNLGIVGQQTTMQQPKEQRTYAGQPCDLYTIQTFGEICLWQGLPLYTKVQIPGEISASIEEATEIKLNLEVADQKFVLPNGIKMQDLSR